MMKKNTIDFNDLRPGDWFSHGRSPNIYYMIYPYHGKNAVVIVGPDKGEIVDLSGGTKSCYPIKKPDFAKFVD